VNSTRPHHVDGSGAATWLEKTIYSKVSTVGPDPTGKYRTPVYTDRTSGQGLGPPRVQTEPLGRVPDPSMWGPSNPQQGPFRWQAVRPCCRMHCTHHDSRVPRKQRRHINIVCTTDVMALGDGPGVAGISYFLPFCPWVHMSGLSILVRAPLSYKREGTRRYKADPT
jgi:hypothetical protein